jgi:hypothetical protein
MQSDGVVSSNPDPGRRLPPVEPPSGRFLAQLFLVPLLIVSVLVLLALAGLWWSKGRYGQDEAASTEHFVRDLESGNDDVWWRGAHELAQVVKRPESLALASYPRFALDLAEKLQQELAVLEQEERAAYQRTRNLSAEEQEGARARLRPQRDRVRFLIAVLGDFTVPVGVPLLSEIAVNDEGPDRKAVVLRRRLAVLALASLGESMKRWPDLPPDKQASAMQDLAAEAGGKGQRAAWARMAQDYLTKHRPLGVDATLEKCAASNDTFLRSLVAMALNFWDGPRTEPTLRRLANDDGHGTRLEITDKDE